MTLGSRSTLCAAAVALSLACDAPRRSPPKEPVASSDAPRSVERLGPDEPAPPPPTFAPEPQDGVRLALEPSLLRAARGDTVTFRVRNVGERPLRYLHPGGSTFCQRFRWEPMLIHARGFALERVERRPCGRARARPREIVIAPGEPGPAARLELDGAWIRRDLVPQPHSRGRHRLRTGAPPPGRYEVVFEGAGRRARGVVHVK